MTTTTAIETTSLDLPRSDENEGSREEKNPRGEKSDDKNLGGTSSQDNEDKAGKDEKIKPDELWKTSRLPYTTTLAMTTTAATATAATARGRAGVKDSVTRPVSAGSNTTIVANTTTAAAPNGADTSSINADASLFSAPSVGDKLSTELVGSLTTTTSDRDRDDQGGDTSGTDRRAADAGTGTAPWWPGGA